MMKANLSNYMKVNNTNSTYESAKEAKKTTASVKRRIYYTFLRFNYMCGSQLYSINCSLISCCIRVISSSIMPSVLALKKWPDLFQHGAIGKGREVRMIQYTFRIEANEREFTSHLVDFQATSVFTSTNQMLYIAVSTLTPDDRKVKT